MLYKAEASFRILHKYYLFSEALPDSYRQGFQHTLYWFELYQMGYYLVFLVLRELHMVECTCRSMSTHVTVFNPFFTSLSPT